MFIIEDNVIYLTKGDTAYLAIDLTDSDGTQFKGAAAITLSCKKNIDDEDYAFQCTCDYPESIKILPTDTKDLECGKYYYDIQVDLDNGDIFTIVPKSPFYIKEEVTE